MGDLVYKTPFSIHGSVLLAKVEIEKGLYIGSYEGPDAIRDGT